MKAYKDGAKGYTPFYRNDAIVTNLRSLTRKRILNDCLVTVEPGDYMQLHTIDPTKGILLVYHAHLLSVQVTDCGDKYGVGY